MWDVRIGETIRNHRGKHKIRQAKLSEGICTVSTLSKIENGVIFPTRYKLIYLLERLGIDSEQYIILSSKREKEFGNMLRVFNSCIKNDVALASYVLKKVEEAVNPADSVEEQIFKECRLRLDIEGKQKSPEKMLTETIDLLKKTKPAFSFDKIRDELLSKTEWNIILDYAKILTILDRTDEALKILLGLKDFFLTKDKDSELIRGDYEIVLLRIVEALLRLGRFSEAEGVSDELIEGVSRNKSTVNLVEIMISRTTIAINLNRPDEQVRKMVDQTRQLIKMDKGSDTAERFDDYLRKECGYAWVNTA